MSDFGPVIPLPPVPPASALTYKRLVEALAAIPTPPAVPPYPDKERREQYADIIRTRIKTLTLPGPYPGAAPMAGATEYDIADVVLAAQDTELAQLRAERDAALRLAAVWADAPDPLVRAGAADLHSAIRGARPHPTPATPDTHSVPAVEPSTDHKGLASDPRTVIAAAIRESRKTGRGHIDCECGSCAVSTGPCHCEPAHCPSAPHDGPAADADAVLQALAQHPNTADRDRLQHAINVVRDFNEFVAASSCRVQAVVQARDTLNHLDRALASPTPSQGTP